MSEENVEVVRKLFESQGDASEFFELLDPHVVWINYASSVETRPYIGHEGVREWAEGFQANFSEFRMEAVELIDAGGDQVVTVHRVKGTGKASGIPVEHEFSSLITLVNGKIVRVQGFEARAEALEAAWLSE
jgi:ketosteroid isomerase-like protein